MWRALRASEHSIAPKLWHTNTAEAPKSEVAKVNRLGCPNSQHDLISPASARCSGQRDSSDLATARRRGSQRIEQHKQHHHQKQQQQHKSSKLILMTAASGVPAKVCWLAGWLMLVAFGLGWQNSGHSICCVQFNGSGSNCISLQRFSFASHA